MTAKFIAALSVAALLSAPAAFAGKIKETFEIAKCVTKRPKIACTIESMDRTNTSEPLQSEEEVVGREDRFVLLAPNDNWRIFKGSKNAQDDVVMFDASRSALLFAVTPMEDALMVDIVYLMASIDIVESDESSATGEAAGTDAQ